MLINCYYYAPQAHSLLHEHLAADIRHIASLGADAVSFCVQESQLSNWHQQRIRNVIDCIHDHGMEAHAVPNRWAGLFAGWLDGYGEFTVKNPDTLVRSEEGLPLPGNEAVSCVHHPKVGPFLRERLAELLGKYDFDGIVWDEPHIMNCFCEHCVALREDSKFGFAIRSFARFVDGLSAHAKALKPGLTVSLFLQPFQQDMIHPFLDQPHLDYLGSDGHVRRPDYQMHRMKGTIFEVHEKLHPILRAAGRKSLFLLEAQRHRDEDLGHYLEQIDAAFSLPADQLMWYYSAHEMSPENERIFNEATWAAVRRVAATRDQSSAASGSPSDISP